MVNFQSWIEKLSNLVSSASFIGFFFGLFSLGLCLQLGLLQMCHRYVLIQRSIPGKDLTTVFAFGLFVHPLQTIVDSFDVLDAMRLSPKHSVAARPSTGDCLVSFHPLRSVAVHRLYVCPKVSLVCEYAVAMAALRLGWSRDGGRGDGGGGRADGGGGVAVLVPARPALVPAQLLLRVGCRGGAQVRPLGSRGDGSQI